MIGDRHGCVKRAMFPQESSAHVKPSSNGSVRKDVRTFRRTTSPQAHTVPPHPSSRGAKFGSLALGADHDVDGLSE
jgi:hypothetical protein